MISVFCNLRVFYGGGNFRQFIFSICEADKTAQVELLVCFFYCKNIKTSFWLVFIKKLVVLSADLIRRTF